VYSLLQGVDIRVMMTYPESTRKIRYDILGGSTFDCFVLMGLFFS